MNKKIFEFSYQAKKVYRRNVLKIVYSIILFYAVLNLILAYLVYPLRQTSISMIPDFTDNSWLLATPLDKTPERGDIMVIKNMTVKSYSKWERFLDQVVRTFTAQQLSYIEKSDFPGTRQKIRRVIGMPGDTIYMRDYVTYIKPAGEKHYLTEFELIERPYNVTFLSTPTGWDTEIGVKGSFEEITLGPDEYFVLGDNRKTCDDSRLWDAINSDHFDGRVILSYFPFSKFKFY